MTTTQNLTDTDIIAAAATKRYADLVVGDTVIFVGGTRWPYIIDTDVIVAVDDLGAHFAGGTYLALADNREILVRA
jgi:hypothetical protein